MTNPLGVLPRAPEEVVIDKNWSVRGRVVPPSCSEGDGTVLCVQVKHVLWESAHFHYASAQIPPDVGIEIASALLVPFNPSLAVNSLDPNELLDKIGYVHMVKLLRPPSSIAFVTSSGATALIGLYGMDGVFTTIPEDCEVCARSQPADFHGIEQNYNIEDDKMDRMLRNIEGSRNH